MTASKDKQTNISSWTFNTNQFTFTYTDVKKKKEQKLRLSRFDAICLLFFKQDFNFWHFKSDRSSFCFGKKDNSLCLRSRHVFSYLKRTVNINSIFKTNRCVTDKDRQEMGRVWKWGCEEKNPIREKLNGMAFVRRERMF